MQTSLTFQPPVVSRPAELPTIGCQRAAIAMGVFDGVHLGHQAILQQLTELAAQTKASPVALFFDPHPRTVLFPDRPQPLLTTVPYRERLLGAAGAAFLIRFPFDSELAALSPHAFLERYFLAPGLTVTGFCVGANWHFGCRNAGSAETLAEWALQHQAVTTAVQPLQRQDSLISSTRIRQAVASGDLDEAAAMLGRPFSLFGKVIRGHGVGSAVLQCPTANLAADNAILPPFGVYIATAQKGDQRFRGITYVGDAPTIRTEGKPQVLVELHLFDCQHDLYGQEILVEFRKFLRASQKFASPEALKKQIDSDIKTARSYEL
ncbi:MAG: riboflavin biosynthesis protein RibF [Lentisphaerae bacterium]|nr:riboflavin biosynthesis protein RibF [Lentisphaerota bacterium]